MKKQRLALIIFLALTCILCTVFAFGCSDKVTYYTVTFMDGQTQVGQPVKVQKGKRIEIYMTLITLENKLVFAAGNNIRSDNFNFKIGIGGYIEIYPTAARSDENYVFDGWFKDEELEKVWNHDVERVTKDITLRLLRRRPLNGINIVMTLVTFENKFVLAAGNNIRSDNFNLV